MPIAVKQGKKDHGTLNGLSDDDHTQYILATGARTGASSSRQQFTSGITIPSARPVLDGTTSIQFQNTAGTTNVLTIDTTNSYLVLDNFGTIQTHSDVTNTIIGISAKSASITGQYNSGFGWNCLDQLTSGTRNTAMGGQALRLLESGARNNGTGWNSLQGLTTGSFNNAMGSDVLYTLSTGSDNCVVGYLGFYNTTTADGNTGIGTGVGQNNVTGSYNSYMGYRAGRNSTGSNNVFLGKFAGENDTSSNRLNIANIATKSLLLGDFSTNTLMIGDTALTVPTAAADIAASTTSRSSLRIRSGTAPTAPNDGDVFKLSDTFVMHGSDATTNAIVNTLRLRRNSSGTAAANFGAGFNVQLKSSTTAGQDAGRITWKWTTATHASRASQADFTTYYTSTERTSISIGSDASNSLLSFHAATPVAKQSITGSRAGNAALADLLTKLATLGLITDSTSA